MSDCCCPIPIVPGTDRRTEPLAGLVDELPAEATVVRAAGFGVLRGGSAATAEVVAEVAGLDASLVREVLAAMAGRGAAELDEHGDVVGIGGLSLTAGPHELVLDGVALHTWCALDALGIPAALNTDATARSRCAWCGEMVEITFHAGAAEGSSEVITWFPQVALDNVRRDFCAVANLFCRRAHLDEWRHTAGDPPGEALTVAEVAERGREIWALEAQTGTAP